MKWFRIAIISLFLGVLGVFWVFPQPFHIAYAKYITFHRYSDSLYASVSLSVADQTLLRENYLVASKRISEFWGKKKGKAAVFYCNDATVYRRFCRSQKGSGCSIITPFGSWIILNTGGMNQDVLAHEMCHDELATRAGWWASRTKIPKWKDEGLALQLDDRFVTASDSIQRYINYKAELQRFSMNNQVTIPLEHLQTEKQFFGGDPVYTQLAYLISATEIARLISLKGRKQTIEELLKDAN